MTITSRTRLLIAAAAGAACAAALYARRRPGRRPQHHDQGVLEDHVGHPHRADGTVVDREPQPGDTLDVFALDYRGNHKRHAKRIFASEHLQCVFGTGEPDCVSHVAIGRSLMMWDGLKLRRRHRPLAGASGRIVSNQEVPGGSDIVAKVKLAKRVY